MDPYSEDERANDDSETALNRMVEDRLYWQERDPEFKRYVDDSFKSVYGDAAAEQDATGRTVAPAPRAVTLPPFHPSVTPEDTALSGPVGDAEPNSWRDVLKVQKGLANTKHYAFDMAKERSGEHSPALGRAIREFQREKNEEIDGLLLPGGPTITRLRENLFGDTAGHGAQSAANRVDNITGVSAKRPPDFVQGREPRAATEGKIEAPRLMQAQYAGSRPRQATPPDGAAKPQDRPDWFTLPTEQFPEKLNKWGNRAVIVKMPDGRNYILREPLPREMRSDNRSDFQLSPGTAAHRMPIDMARARFEFAVPMTLEEAREAQERATRGQSRHGDEPHQARIPMRRNGGNGVYIRYYFPDGRHEDTLAWNAKTNEQLFAAGGEPVFIAAEDALKLGLIDWMSIEPPNYTKAFPLPTLKNVKGPLTWLNYLARVAAYLEDQSVEGAKERYFGRAPRDAERTWR